MNRPDAKRTAEFMRLLHAFQAVERVMYAPDLVRKENDVEHSYLLALFCWYLVDSLKLSYSVEKVLKYALAHDLPEVYAGDTYIFDTKALETKKDRELEARKRLGEEFPEFGDMHRTVDEYENGSDPESKFVRAADKLLPLVTNYLQGGKIWKEMSISSDELFAHKRSKIGDEREIRELLEQFLTEFSAQKGKYFDR